jgi:hypothetical protein
LKAYVTKWWEASGIVEHEGELYEGKYFTSGAGYTKVFVRFGTDAFGTRAEAVAKVKKAAAKKAASLEAKVIVLKKIAKEGL